MTRSDRRGGIRPGTLLVLLLVIGGAVVAIVLATRGGGPSGPSGTTMLLDVPDPVTPEMQPRVAALIRGTRADLLAEPDSAGAWGQYAAVLDVHELYEPAEACYREAIARAPDDYRWHYLRAVVLEVMGGERDEIIGELRAASALEPGYATIYYRIGDLQARGGQARPAAEAYRQALDAAEDFIVARRGLGQMLLQLDDLEGARRELEAVRAVAPEDRPTLTSLARVYARLGDEERATEAAVLARRLGQDVNSSEISSLTVPDPLRYELEQIGISARLCDERASRLIAEGKYGPAIENLLIVEETRPDDPTVHLRLGTAHLGLGRAEEAITRLRRGLELDDASAVGHLLLGGALLAVDDAPGAVLALRRAVALAPDNHLAYRRLAAAAATAGRFDEAATARRVVLDATPDDADLHFELGRVLEELGAPNEAILHYEEAAALVPNHAAATRLRELEGG